MCVHCTVHNCCTQIAQNRPDNFPPYPPDNHHSSDDVYLREGGFLLKQEMMGWQWHQLAHMQIIAPRSRQITMPSPHHTNCYWQDALPDSNQQCQGTEGDRMWICQHQLQVSKTWTQLRNQNVAMYRQPLAGCKHKPTVNC